MWRILIESQYASMLIVSHRRAQANIRAVDERQALEGISREEKTASRNVSVLQDKHDGFEEKLASRQQELVSQKERKREVSFSQ